MHKRYVQLDSIRGLAAISVFFSHILLVTSTPLYSFSVNHVTELPLYILEGKSSYSLVNFFFVLSGFVLCLHYTKGKSDTYIEFIIIRFFRIYIPYIVAVIFSIIVCLFLSKGGIEELSSWFNQSWTETLTMKAAFNHLMMLGNFNTNSYNNVIWSIVQEMRVSLIFPLIAFVVIRFSWKSSLLVCLGLSSLNGLNNLFHWEHSHGYHTSFFSTLQIINMFVLGCLLAKHLDQLCDRYIRLSKISRKILQVLTILSVAYNELFMVLAGHLGIYYYGEILSDYSIGLGSCVVILISIASTRAEAFLSVKPLQNFGKISYGLYLYHLPTLFSLIYIFYELIPLWIIFLISIPIATMLAFASWLIVEKPSSRYGKNVANKVAAFLISRNDNTYRSGSL